MATYKKRGGRPKTKVEQQTKIEEDSATAEVFNTLDEGANKAEKWVAENQKYIFGVIGLIALGILGYLAYQTYVQEPKEAKAMNEMFQAQNYWEQAMTATENDSLFNLALKGGNGQYGLEEIISKYGGTDAGNIARYYAGVAYLQTGEYKKAIESLDAFNATDEILAPQAKGGIGDAFAALGEFGDALNYYKQAANLNTNDYTTPKYLLKAGKSAIETGNYSEAVQLLAQIKENYPDSPFVQEAQIFLGQAEAMQ
ncbi:tetratricopeptide repeat protein [Gilvibacter sp.]|uniref:tetratricopeptide repeat protein n=1 Tax=Gilvibacter sp. TaxID=2729997 RepID=UPI0025C37873|nr:tetratricopeptide repeat protein [Gilvibacter sp.]NQX78044.1 tetratricopeptide repeat protein [Gilvibacter sp.]